MTARFTSRIALLLLPATLCLARPSTAQAIFDVNLDVFGANPNDTVDDGPAIRNAIAAAVAAGGGTVVFHDGVYLVGSVGGAGLALQNAQNVTLQPVAGAKPTLAFLDRTAHGITIQDCTNLRFQDLVLTWRDPCHFEGTLLSAQPTSPGGDASEYVLDCPGVDTTDPFLFAASASWQLHFFHPKTRTRRAFSAKLKGVLTGVTGTQLTLQMPEWTTSDPAANGTALQDAVAVTVESSAGNAIWSTNSNQLWFERVRIERAPFFGAQHNGDGAVTYVECTIGAGPGIDAPPLVSTNRDGLRFRSQRGTPSILRCRIERCGDDAINVFSPWLVAVQTGQSTQLWDAGDPLLQNPNQPGQPWSLSLRRNDRLLIYDPINFQLLGAATIASVTPTHIVTTTGMALTPNVRILNATAHARGTVVQDNFIRDVEARAMLVRSNGGTITGNRIVGTPKGAIQLVADAQYYKEGGFARAIDLSGNTIHVAGFERWNWSHPESCHLGAVTIGVSHTQPSWPTGYGHAEISVADNWVAVSPLAGAFVASVNTTGTDPRLPAPLFGASIAGNWILASQIRPSAAGSARGIAGATGGVHLLHVDATTVDDNVIHSHQPGPLVTKVDYGATVPSGTRRAFATSFEVEEDWLWGGRRLLPFAGRKLAGTPTSARVDGTTMAFHDWHLQGRDAALDFARGYVCSVCPASGGNLRIDVPSGLLTTNGILTFWATSKVVSTAAPQPLDVELQTPNGLVLWPFAAHQLTSAPQWTKLQCPIPAGTTSVTLRRPASDAEVFVDDLVIALR